MLEYSVYYNPDKPLGDFINAVVSIIINKFTGRLLVINGHIINWDYLSANRHSPRVKTFIELAIFDQSDIFVYNYAAANYIGDILLNIGADSFSIHTPADIDRFKKSAVVFEIVNFVHYSEPQHVVEVAAGDEISIVLDPVLLSGFGASITETIIGLIYYKLQIICKLIHIAPLMPKINLFKKNRAEDCRIKIVTALINIGADS